MRLVRAASLAATLDAVNAALFFGQTLTRSARTEAARWIAGRQGLPGSYAGMFAPTARDFGEGIAVFTGERVRTRAATAHILGEEACRALMLLKPVDAAAKPALVLATRNMLARLDDTERRGYSTATYCCGPCTCAYWRHLASGGLCRQEERLTAGMRVLKSRRLANRRWRVFPFWYTLLVLTETDVPGANAERQFAAPVCEQYLRRPPAGKYAVRRHRIAERILEET